jgi:hypothetical protein
VRRPRYPKADEPRPPALPPATQTVGQLVAETLRFYGSRFLAMLPLGIPLAIADEVALDLTTAGRVLVLVAAAPFFAATYAIACAVVFDVRPATRSWVVAVVAGTLAFLPAAAFFPWFALVSVAWLAMAGHVVPASIREGVGFVDAFRRSREVARADYVHAVGGLAALVLVFGLTRLLLGLLLREQADNTIRVSVFLADVVLAPILFLGGALLYLNLAARVGTDRESRRRSRRTPSENGAQ